MISQLPSTAEDWPSLVSIDNMQLPRLDLSHLPAWAGEFAAAVAADTETPPELAAGMVLAACSTAAARRLKVMVKPGFIEPCNLWVVVALPPGNRKSAVQSAAIEPIAVWEHDQAILLEPKIKSATSELKTMEARAKELRNKAAKERDRNKAKLIAQEVAEIESNLPEIPVEPRMWTSDATPERLGALLGEHQECIAWLSSEGGIFELLQGRYSGGIPNLDLVLKAYSGDRECVDRSSRQAVRLRYPRLSIGLSPQPAVLESLSSKPGFRGRGLLGRFIYLLPPSPLGFRPLESNPVPESIKNAYAAGIHAMLNWEPATDERGDEQPYLVKLSPEAFALYHTFAQKVEIKMRPGQAFEYYTDWTGKAPALAARLACVLHGIKHAHGQPWGESISTETMKAALEILSVAAVHTLTAFNLMGADPVEVKTKLV